MTPALVGLLLAAAAVRLPNLFASLWYDEIFVTHVRIGSPMALAERIAGDTHPPGLYLFMYAWTAVFGDSELALRMPALLCGVATVAFTFVLADRVADRPTAWLAAALIAFSPTAIYYSVEARQYAALAMLSPLALLGLFGLRGRRSMRSAAISAATLAASVFTHFYGAVHLGLAGAFALRERNAAGRRLLIFLIAIGAALAGFIALRAAAVSMKSLGYLRPLTPPELWHLLFNWFPLGNTLAPLHGRKTWSAIAAEPPGLLALEILLCLAFVRGVAALVADRGRGGGEPLWLLAFLLAPLVAFLIPPWLGWERSYIERSLFFVQPLFAIVLARGATALPPVPRRVATALLTAVAIVATVAFHRRANEWTVYKPKPDWRSAAAHLRSEGGAERQLVLHTGPGTVLLYYEPDAREVPLGFASDTRREEAKWGRLRGRFAERARALWQRTVRENRPEEARVALVMLLPGDLAELASRARAAGYESFYLARDRTWDAGSARLFAELERDPEFRHEGAWHGEAIDIHRFRLVEDGVPAT